MCYLHSSLQHPTPFPSGFEGHVQSCNFLLFWVIQWERVTSAHFWPLKCLFPISFPASSFETVLQPNKQLVCLQISHFWVHIPLHFFVLITSNSCWVLVPSEDKKLQWAREICVFCVSTMNINWKFPMNKKGRMSCVVQYITTAVLRTFLTWDL